MSPALGLIDCELIRGPCGQGIPAPVQAMGSGSGAGQGDTVTRLQALRSWVRVTPGSRLYMYAVYPSHGDPDAGNPIHPIHFVDCSVTI